MIAAVRDEHEDAKTMILSQSEGGTVKGVGIENGTFTVLNGETKEITITPNEHYIITELLVSGREIEIGAGDTPVKINVNYEDINDLNKILDVKFTAINVLENDSKRGETEVIQKPEKAYISNVLDISNNLENIEIGEKIVIDANVIAHNGINIYNWYKDEQKLVDQRKANLEINNASIEDSGKYKLIVTTILGARSVQSVSEEFTVSVMEKEELEITSNTYKIEDGYISNVLPGADVGSLKANLNATKDIKITDKDGNSLEDTSKLTTGMKVIMDEKEYVISVIGDIDGNGDITLTDFAKLKAHYIESDKLSGAFLKSADINKDGNVGLDDLAKLRLVLIGLAVIE